eukprot:2833025-Prymnesium_polylepis.1
MERSAGTVGTRCSSAACCPCPPLRIPTRAVSRIPRAGSWARLPTSSCRRPSRSTTRRLRRRRTPSTARPVTA